MIVSQSRDYSDTIWRQAMALIGIRDLRQKTSEIIRRIQEENAEYVVTYQGKPVALLLPIDTEEVEKAMLEAGKRSATGWERYKKIAEEIRREWPEDVDAQKVLEEIRR